MTFYGLWGIQADVKKMKEGSFGRVQASGYLLIAFKHTIVGLFTLICNIPYLVLKYLAIICRWTILIVLRHKLELVRKVDQTYAE